MNKNGLSEYTNSVHRIGRTGTVIAILIMLGIPVTMCTYFDMWPKAADHLMFCGGLLALYVPTGIVESVTYTPILGSSIYMSLITGNVSNIKLPCALNALDIAKAEQNTDEGDAVCTIAIAVSSSDHHSGCHCGCAHAGAPAASFKLPHSPGGYFLHAAGPLWVYVHPPYGDKSGGRKDHGKVEDDDSPHFNPAGNSGICDKAQQGNRCADHHTGHDPLLLASL